MDSLQLWGIGLVVSVIVAVFLRFCPKQKLIDVTTPISDKLAGALSKILESKLGKKAAVSVEEGIIITILSVIVINIRVFAKRLVKDNGDKFDPMI